MGMAAEEQNNSEQSYRAMLVEEVAAGKYDQTIVRRPLSDLPVHPVRIAVSHSSLNYKDALSAFGNRAITREYPHTPGIDAGTLDCQLSVQSFVILDAARSGDGPIHGVDGVAVDRGPFQIEQSLQL